jgi:hypothetical protein
MYCLLGTLSYEKKHKGIKKAAYVCTRGDDGRLQNFEKLSSAHFEREYEDPDPNRVVAFTGMVSRNHFIHVCNQTKKCVSAFNDKVFQWCRGESRPLGHWRNRA